jgi:serine/threonine-protein kinase
MAKVCPNCELAYGDDDFFCAVDGSPLRSTGAEPDNLVGTVIADRYRVEAILGEGGMGRVYRARHVRVPREAAIKVLRRALIADPYAVAAFNREARNAASVGDHPNVAAVYDFGETSDGLVFLAMEFIDGETLGRRLEREPVLPPGRAVEIVRQIGAGLTAAHELPEPVVHRDLKPDNILLKATRDGSDWVKIVDFGIAKAAKRETQLLTTPGLVVGTPRYMSPEQLTGGTIDVRSDIYALAMIAFQMLTGRMPFSSSAPEEESSIQWALQRLTLTPLTLRQVCPDVQWPPAAQEAFDRALARQADDRTPSATEFTRTLAHAFGLHTPSGVTAVVAEVPGPLSSAVRTASRSTAPTAPLSVTDDVLPAARPPASSRGRGAPAAAARADGVSTPASPTRSGRSWVTAAVVGGAVVIAVAAGLLWQRRGGADAAPATSVPATSPNDSATSPAANSKSGGVPGAKQDSQLATRGSPPNSSGKVVKTKSDNQPSSSPTTAPVPPNAAVTPVIEDRPTTSAASRAELDRLKAALSDPDAVSTAGNGEAILRDVRQLLPRLTVRADSVEATYYAIETNLILDRPADACRLLTSIRPSARGTLFEARVERFLADTDLGCANRR